MNYEVNILRREGDKYIRLKVLRVDAKNYFISWDNKTYPLKGETCAYVDPDKKTAYFYFEHDNINPLIMDAEGLINGNKIEEIKGKVKESFVLRLKRIGNLVMTASELDMFINQNVIANVFSRLKNFGGNVNRTTLIWIILCLALGVFIGYVTGTSASVGKEVIVYRNATIPNIPSV